jgi:hypothetical protein
MPHRTGLPIVIPRRYCHHPSSGRPEWITGTTAYRNRRSSNVTHQRVKARAVAAHAQHAQCRYWRPRVAGREAPGLWWGCLGALRAAEVVNRGGSDRHDQLVEGSQDSELYCFLVAQFVVAAAEASD